MITIYMLQMGRLLTRGPKDKRFSPRLSHTKDPKMVHDAVLLNTRYYKVSSSSRAASTDISDPLSPLLPITHRFWQVFRVASHILT